MPRKFLLLGLLLASATAEAAQIAQPIYPVIANAPADPLAYRALTLSAKQAFDAGDYPKAETLYRQATDLYPIEWQNWRYLAASLRLQEKWKDAIPAYERLVALSGTFIGSGRYWQAVGHTKLGERDKAMALIKTMIDQDHEINRPGLATDEHLKPLWDDPEFRALTAPSIPAGTDRVAGWRGDLNYLVSEFHRLYPDYRGRPLPARTQALVDKLDADIPKLSDNQIFTRLSEIVGSLRLNHTMFWGAPPPGSSGPAARVTTTFLPLQFYAFPEGIYVVGADASHAALVGNRVEAVGGVPIATVMKGIDTTVSYRSDAELTWTAPRRLATVPLLAGLGYAKHGAPVALTLSKDGRNQTVELAPVADPVGNKLPAPPGVTAPRFLTKNDDPQWLEPLPEARAIYVQFSQVMDGKDESLPDFGRKLRLALDDPAVDNVILDMRLNNGGNSFLSTELERTLIGFSTKPGKQVYVLIGRNVYSAAGNFVTDMERLANPVFVGEPTGNMGNQDGDEGHIKLPYSGLLALVAAVKWQLSHPWDVRGTIVPHMPVPLTAADYFAGRDPVMDATLKIIAGSSGR
jgi:tetratricopeptide (TPR) repeat protein